MIFFLIIKWKWRAAGVRDEQSNSITTNYFTSEKISGNISNGIEG